MANSLVINAPTVAAQSGIELTNSESMQGYTSPIESASNMVRAIATKNHKIFVRSRLLGVCEGKNDWPSRYAECLHTTQFSSEKGELTVFDMTRRLMPDTVRVVSMKEMDVPHGLLVSSYYGEQFMNVEVVIADYDGLEYRTRIVVAKISDRWYAIPRRGRCGFYAIADAIPSVPTKAD
ncbi:hypothetical protein CA13_11280 [Planctomycetes bacterium CA13]|uniref:Uncharacterized protein n=1 Tax=Novipirellula herctigrandis TaxID=2527986 RepID=A0A5C5YYQ2_9BACT|nr:hypothetical protein CA13_11280 [Planctomycetes bacterium CA13]